MLYPILRLQTDALGEPQLVATEQRSWRPRLLIGREFCVFEAVPCRGVAWHELGSFALLQAKRLAPYVRSGASAAVKNKTLMLWFWDQQDLEAALQRAGSESTDARPIAETLMLELPSRHGDSRLRCARGVDSMTLDGGAIISSHWDNPASTTAHAASALSRPWAHDHIGTSLDATSAGLAAPLLQRGLGALSLAAMIGCGIYAAYWGGSLLGAQERLAALEGEAQLQIDRIEKLAALRSSETRDRDWLIAYNRLGASFRFDEFLQALESPLAARNVVLKELEIRNDEARLQMVSTGSEIDLPSMLEVLGTIPGVDDVALRDNADAKQATFTLHSPGYRRIVSPVTTRPY